MSTMENQETEVEKGIVREDYDLLKWQNPCIKFSLEKEKGYEEDGRDEDYKTEEDSFTIEEPIIDEVSEIINSIFPPRQWDENGETWIQYVSSSQSPRSEINALSEKLAKTLQTSGALQSGYCEIRRNIYTQLFDELVRAITASDTGRGLLLLRVRDDMKMTIDTLRTLADSAVTLGKQKAVEAEEGVPELLKSIENLEENKTHNENKLHALKKMYAVRERGFKDWKNREVAKHQRKIDFLKATNEGIQNQWDLITAWKPQNIEMEKYLFKEDL